MSHNRVKTTCTTLGPWGTPETHMLYADHNNSCDIVTFYDEDGTVLFCVEDTEKNNMYDAIVRLMSPYNGDTLEEGIEVMNKDDRELCKL